jgi:SWI/SNF-related matrix-associated actin-dependent regulator of chromatin subfamily A-like protein 1
MKVVIVSMSLLLRSAALSISQMGKNIPRMKLFPYQLEGVVQLVERKRLLLADEMGLGKSVQCIEAINTINNKDIRVLIVCPKSVVNVWEYEIQRWLTLPLVLHVASPKSFQISTHGSITLINYDICAKFQDQLRNERYDVLICDEAHYLKTWSTKRTIAILGGENNTGISSEYLWLLTGTPVMNRPVELYPLLRAINPNEFPSFDDYASRYCNPKPIRHSTGSSYIRTWMDYSGAKNLVELSQRLAPIMLRRLKSEILNQLPPKYRSCVCLLPEQSNAAQQERERLLAILEQKSGATLELDSFGAKAADLITYLGKTINIDTSDPESRNIILGSIATIRKETALAKLDPAVNILQDMIKEHKVVVFAHHRELILELMKQFGEQAVCIMGGMNSEARATAVQSFQNDDSVRIFIGSVRAAGVGLTLTAASHVVFLELDWSPSVMTQAEDRCHRVGQTNSVNVQYFVFKDTIDEWIAKSLMYKQSKIEQILPEKKSGFESEYVLDFGIHKGLRLEAVPRSYISFLTRNDVWRNRPKLWEALFSIGILLEEPPKHVPKESKEATSMSTTTTTPPMELRGKLESSQSFGTIEYIFNFGKYKGKSWTEVPEDYRSWIIENEVWKTNKRLEYYLQEAGFL